MHANDSSGLTPGHKNPLDVDRRGFSYALMRCARAWVYAIRRLLEKHETVKVWFLVGKGYRALRDTRAVVYHENYGECERHTVAAAMLEDAAA